MKSIFLPINHKVKGVSTAMSRYTNFLGEVERLQHVNDTGGVRVGRAIEVEVKIPKDMHLTSKEVAVFQKITDLTEKRPTVFL